MANTSKLNLPLVDSAMTADVPRDMNALANAVDSAVDEAATANKLAKRGTGGTLKAGAPVASDDVIRKTELDAHAALGSTAHGATASPTVSTLMARDSSGRSQVADPTQPQDIANKAYVDAIKQGLDVKDSVRVATTANITLSGTQTIDGVVLVAGDRVLVKNQTSAADNGIYVVAAGAWTRAVDANTSAKVTPGMYTFVEEGTANGDYGFTLTTNNPITLGTTALMFTQFSGAGQIAAGNGLTKSGNTINGVDAAVGTKGVVALDSSTNSTDESKAATPKAVKSAYDLANAAIPAGTDNAAAASIFSLLLPVDTRNLNPTAWDAEERPTTIQIRNGTTVLGTVTITYNTDGKITQLVLAAGGKTITYTQTWAGLKFTGRTKVVS